MVWFIWFLCLCCYLNVCMSKAVLFIDGGYLAKISKSFGMPKIDFLALSETLCRQDGGLMVAAVVAVMMAD